MSNGLRLTSLLALAALAAAGCGSTPVRTAHPVAEASAVDLALVSPDGGTVTSAGHITVRGTVTPPDASVMVQGRPASVRNGVFTGQARLHRGRTTIDVIASASGAAAGSESVTVTRRSPKPKPAVRTTVVAPAPTTVLVRTAAVPAGGSCGAGVSAGANTSCAFALNVRDAYYDQGPGNVTAYSPVADRTYTMRCARSAPVGCTGADDAAVYIHTSVRRTASYGRR